MPSPNGHSAQKYFEQLQDSICHGLETADRKGKFILDAWEHADQGWGRTRILTNGGVFEKAGVNTSAISSKLSEALARRLEVQPQEFFATGISLVLHPESPMIPAVHANFRYLELKDGDAWFGGGADLSPSYLFKEDVRHFHTTLMKVCNRHDPGYYTKFKRWCDEYFFIKHRNETRGVGGIFFDYLKGDFEELFGFVRDCGDSFLGAYVPIVERRRIEAWGEQEKQWQLLRRSRYAEFNLAYDRGTVFGLESQGRVESILMSLPPLARWDYEGEKKFGAREMELVEVLSKPREWVEGTVGR